MTDRVVRTMQAGYYDRSYKGQWDELGLPTFYTSLRVSNLKGAPRLRRSRLRHNPFLSLPGAFHLPSYKASSCERFDSDLFLDYLSFPHLNIRGSTVVANIAFSPP